MSKPAKPAAKVTKSKAKTSGTSSGSKAAAAKGARLIRGGKIFTASEEYSADILILGETIAQIGIDLQVPAGTEIIDAKGLEIYPGGIDVHTHFELPFMGTVSADDFASGTRAAACGGTTTIVDFVIPSKEQEITDALKAWHKKADGKCAIDYGFHIALVEFNDKVARAIPKVVEAGVTSFKCFLAYKGALMIDDGQLLEVFDVAKEHGALVSVHAENGEILAYLNKMLASLNLTEPKYHAVAHPSGAEGEATHRAIRLAEMARAPLYIVHLSCEEAMSEVNEARSRGSMIFAETCPQYLLLDDTLYDKKNFEGAKWVMSPPLRPEHMQDMLWEGLRDGALQTVATDHCSFNFAKQKTMGRDSFAKIPNGIPGVGDRVELLYTYGVQAGRLSRQQFAAVIATNPARLFGMYPRKGVIAPGADADLVLIDPKKTGTISAKTTHHNVDYSAFEGFKLQGRVAMVLSRGVTVSRDQKFTGKQNHGTYLKRKPFVPADWGFEAD